MEVTKSYPVNRMMHTRPTTEVSSATTRLVEEHQGLTINARNPQGSERGTKPVNCQSVMSLLTNTIGTYGSIEVIVSGEYSRETLEKCADEIGEVFGRASEEIPFGEKMYRKNFGDQKEGET